MATTFATLPNEMVTIILHHLEDLVAVEDQPWPYHYAAVDNYRSTIHSLFVELSTVCKRLKRLCRPFLRRFVYLESVDLEELPKGYRRSKEEKLRMREARYMKFAGEYFDLDLSKVAANLERVLPMGITHFSAEILDCEQGRLTARIIRCLVNLQHLVLNSMQEYQSIFLDNDRQQECETRIAFFEELLYPDAAETVSEDSASEGSTYPSFPHEITSLSINWDEYDGCQSMLVSLIDLAEVQFLEIKGTSETWITRLSLSEISYSIKGLMLCPNAYRELAPYNWSHLNELRQAEPDRDHLWDDFPWGPMPRLHTVGMCCPGSRWLKGVLLQLRDNSHCAIRRIEFTMQCFMVEQHFEGELMSSDRHSDRGQYIAGIYQTAFELNTAMRNKGCIAVPSDWLEELDEALECRVWDWKEFLPSTIQAQIGYTPDPDHYLRDPYRF